MDAILMGNRRQWAGSLCMVGTVNSCARVFLRCSPDGIVPRNRAYHTHYRAVIGFGVDLMTYDCDVRLHHDVYHQPDRCSNSSVVN